MKRIGFFIFVVLTSIFLWSCSSPNSPDSSDGTTKVYTPVSVTPGVSTTPVSASVSPSGGSVTLNQGAMSGLKVTFPAGALSKTVSVSLANVSGTFTPNSGTAGKIFSITTPGVKSFDQPATFTVPFTGSGVPVPYYIDSLGRLNPVQIVSIDHANNTFTFQTFHASPYTWILESLLDTSTAIDEKIGSDFRPENDGFKIVNNGSVYNRAGECFGMTSFSLWYHQNYTATKGAFYNKYTGVVGTNGLTGHHIIATRSFISIAQQWNTYLPVISRQQSLTEQERAVNIKNAIRNTSQPVLIYLYHSGVGTDSGNGAHSVLCYAYDTSNTFYIYNPNTPGTTEKMYYNAGTKKFSAFAGYGGIVYNGSGRSLFLTEPYQNILNDADANFHSSDGAVIRITSDSSGRTLYSGGDTLRSGDTVTHRNMTVTGKIHSGQVKITRLEISVGSDVFAATVNSDSTFSVTLSLTVGVNHLKFNTKGPDADGNLIDQLPNNMATTDFTLYLNVPLSVILMTLTWNTNGTDMDTYVIDPKGDYSSYYHKPTADGGVLDYDITTGYGPEHWTLLNTNTVRYDSAYKFRVHYYSDHASGPTMPTSYEMAIKLYEGTPREITYYYGGTLAYDSSGNASPPTATGADWADVASVTLSRTAAPKVALGKMAAFGMPVITAPIPDAATIRALKRD